jgi:hypothetical protein
VREERGLDNLNEGRIKLAGCWLAAGYLALTWERLSEVKVGIVRTWP